MSTGTAKKAFASNANVRNRVAFETTNNILKSWGASVAQITNILQMSKSAYHKAVAEPESVKLCRDQITRVSLILNIYAAIKTIFDNPENQTGFMSFKNDNGKFGGRSPLEVIASGDILELIETTKHIDGLRGAMW
ncbi:hypothetical protein OCF84_21770 (plasmid) [Shewanella xiamenensis]|uniref:DUF2384 domain-containing protein n=1 Tax=Shewanella xiamenensis TaxID=332186 RepID=A0ABT6UDH5_9GAMM|nr:hypothetical protein [Shewanella xiamenensis]MDI5832492.1 hypothetical protein [Shewanella xiamenensis]WHF57889.1 hypothetical protein OCF84_21770 [Shewanella xiamenensis]